MHSLERHELRELLGHPVARRHPEVLPDPHQRTLELGGIGARSDGEAHTVEPTEAAASFRPAPGLEVRAPMARPPSTVTATRATTSSASVLGSPAWSERRPITGGPTMNPV